MLGRSRYKGPICYCVSCRPSRDMYKFIKKIAKRRENRLWKKESNEQR